VPTVELRELVLQYDSAGHEAFEDAPGTWIRHKSDAGGHARGLLGEAYLRAGAHVWVILGEA
jgi:hypothetical protein